MTDKAEMCPITQETIKKKKKKLHKIKEPAHLAGRRMMETVWVERQRKAALFCRDTEEPQKGTGPWL